MPGRLNARLDQREGWRWMRSRPNTAPDAPPAARREGGRPSAPGAIPFRSLVRTVILAPFLALFLLAFLAPAPCLGATDPGAPPSPDLPSTGSNIFFTLEPTAEGTAVRAGWVAEQGQIAPLPVPGHQYVPAVVYAGGRKARALPVAEAAREVDTACGVSSERLVKAQVKEFFATLAPLSDNYRAVPSDEAKAQAGEAVGRLLAKAAGSRGLDPASIRTLVADAADLNGDRQPEILVAAWVRPRSEPDVPGVDLVLPFWVSAPPGKPAVVILDGLQLALDCFGKAPPSAFGFSARTAGVHDFDADGQPEFGLATVCGQSPAVFTVFKHQNGRLEPVFQSLPPPACGGARP